MYFCYNCHGELPSLTYLFRVILQGFIWKYKQFFLFLFKVAMGEGDEQTDDQQQAGFVVLASGDNQDTGLQNVNMLSQGDYVENIEHVANINFVQQQDGSLIYSQGDGITLESIQKAALMQTGTNITTLVVDGNNVVAQGDGSAVLLGPAGDQGVQYVPSGTSNGVGVDGQYPAGTVTYVGGTGNGNEQMQIAVEYPGGLNSEDYQHVYQTEGSDVVHNVDESSYVYEENASGEGLSQVSQEKTDDSMRDSQQQQQAYEDDVGGGYTESYQVGVGDPMLPAEGSQQGE